MVFYIHGRSEVLCVTLVLNYCVRGAARVGTITQPAGGLGGSDQVPVSELLPARHTRSARFLLSLSARPLSLSLSPASFSPSLFFFPLLPSRRDFNRAALPSESKDQSALISVRIYGLRLVITIHEV